MKPTQDLVREMRELEKRQNRSRGVYEYERACMSALPQILTELEEATTLIEKLCDGEEDDCLFDDFGSRDRVRDQFRYINSWIVDSRDWLKKYRGGE